MRHRRVTGLVVIILVLVPSLLAGCSSERSEHRTLTYWATNQGSSPQQDLKILNEEFEKFTARTGIEVDVEVVGWGDMLNKILGAAVSGVGPDVVNLGNTWSASLQATDAFVPFTQERMRQLGGRDRFLDTSMGSTGMADRPPSSVPLYGLTYGVFYNKAMFERAGVERPPDDWEEFVEVARKLTRPEEDVWGLTLPAASYTDNSHFCFMFGRQEGTDFFGADGKAAFTSEAAVSGVRRYVELMSRHRVVNPDDAEIGAAGEAINNFATGDSAMLMAQNSAIATVRASGMEDSEWGVFPMPVPRPLAEDGEAVRGIVGGTNIAIFRDSPRKEAAMKLVEFMTGSAEQKILNEKYGSLPVVEDAYDHPAFNTDKMKTFSRVLGGSAEPLPMIPNESKFETTTGAAARQLFARSAVGKPVRRSDVVEALSAAQQKMSSSRGTGE